MFRRHLALLIAAALASGCASADTGSRAEQPTRSDPATFDTTDVAETTEPATTETGRDPETTASTDVPDTTVVDSAAAIPVAFPPAAPPPLALSGDMQEWARVIADASASTTDDRLAGTLAAFTAAQLPLAAQDTGGVWRPLTPNDSAGLPWSAVSSIAITSRPDVLTSLTDTVALFRLIDPAADIDPAIVSAELITGLRDALALTPAADGTVSGPAFLAHLVAEQARRANGVELADPATTAAQIMLPESTSVLIVAAALQGTIEGLMRRGELPAAGSSTDPADGPPRVEHDAASDFSFEPGPARLVTDAECADDGANGWLLWVVSKIATGTQIPFLPLSYEGLFGSFAQFGFDRGFVSAGDLEFVKGTGKVLGIANALLVAALFKAQVSDRRAVVEMSGSGPLKRTKDRNHGEPREISVTISYESDDPEKVEARNCLLAVLAALGNNSQQVNGAAAGVTVGVEGGQGFAAGLDTSKAIVLFGPAQFQPVMTADENGHVTIPVQGRAQAQQIPESAPQENKVFSVILEASLDPTDASTISRSFADDVLCASTALGGGGFQGTATECINAVTDIMKQFKWDLGEYEFPLTDWTTGWVVSGNIGPDITATGTICDNSGNWNIDLAAALEGATYTGTLTTAINPNTGDGGFHMQGTLSYLGEVVILTSDGSATLVQKEDGSATLDIADFESTADSPIGVFSKFGAGSASLTLTPATTECGE